MKYLKLNSLLMVLCLGLLSTVRADDNVKCTVTNNRADSVRVKVWTNEAKALAPKEAATFPYARLSQLPFEAFTADGKQIFQGKLSPEQTAKDFDVELKADGSVEVKHGDVKDVIANIFK